MMLSSSSAPVAQALRGACRSARRALCSHSVSSTRAQEASGSHTLRIGGYLLLDKSFPTGEPVVSAPFRVGAREWELGYYPNGILNPHSVGAVLRPARGLCDAVAEYRVSILDRAGNQVYSRSVGRRSFSWMSWDSVERFLRLEEHERNTLRLGPAVVDLVAKEELRRVLPHLLDDDCLSVRCDVTALDLVVDTEN